eukprot:g1786.t1
MGCLLSVDDSEESESELVSWAALRSDSSDHVSRNSAPRSDRSGSGKERYAARRLQEKRRFSNVYKTGRISWTKTNLNDWDAEALLREVDTLKALDHPNIEKIFDVFYEQQCFGVTKEQAERGEYNSLCFIVTELMAGGELLDRLHARDTYTEADARKLAGLLVRAIAHCHSRGVVHRDIKPQNLLLQSDKDDWHIKVADFGMAAVVGREEETRRHTVCGTRGYMAPEVSKAGGGYDTKVDVYSIGVTMYLLLSGEMPFAEQRRAQVRHKAARAAEVSKARAEACRRGSGLVSFDGDAWAGVSSAAKCCLWHAMHPDPAKRPSCDTLLKHGWFAGTHSDCWGAPLQPDDMDTPCSLMANLQSLRDLRPPRASRAGAPTDFEERVLNSAQHTLVVFHTPFGIDCMTFLPKYAALERASELEAAESKTKGSGSARKEILFARIDATQTDVARHVALDFDQLPTVMLFKAGAKNTPIAYVGELEVLGIRGFIQQHCAVGWLAFGLCGDDGGMVGAEVALARPAQPRDTVAEHRINGRSASSVVPVPAAERRVVAGAVTQTRNTTTLRFTKLLRPAPTPLEATSGAATPTPAKARPPEAVGDDAAPTLFCFAHGSSNVFGYHGSSSRGSAAVRITRSSTSGASVQIVEPGSVGAERALLEAHATLMVLAFGLFLPAGVCAAHFCRAMQHEGWWFRLHRAVQATGLVLAIAGFVSIVRVFEARGAGHFYLTHHKLGLGVMVVAVLQPINAVFRPPQAAVGKHITWAVLHKVLGYSVIALGIVNCFLGLGLDTTQGFPNLRGQTRTFFLTCIGTVAAAAVTMLGLVALVDQDEIRAAAVLGYSRSAPLRAMRAVSTTAPRGAGAAGWSLACVLHELPHFMDMVTDYVRSRSYAVGVLLFIFFQAIVFVEELVRASTRAGAGASNAAYGYGEHIAVLTIASLPLFLGNSRHHTHVWAIASFFVVPVCVASTVVVSDYLGFQFTAAPLAQLTAFGALVLLFSVRILLRHTGVTADQRYRDAKRERCARYTRRLLVGARRAGKAKAVAVARRQNHAHRRAADMKATAEVVSEAGWSLRRALALAWRHIDEAFQIDEEACRPYPLRFLIAQWLAFLVVIKLGIFALGPGRQVFDSAVRDLLLGPRDSFLLAAAMNRELSAQTEPLAAMCDGGGTGALVPGLGGALAAEAAVAAAGGLEQICQWRFGGVTGAVIEDGVLSVEPAVNFESAASQFEQLHSALVRGFPVSVAGAMIVVLATILLAFPRYQAALLAVRAGKLLLWDREAEEYGPRASPACDFVGLQISCAAAAFVSSFALFELILLLALFDPMASAVYSLASAFLPVILAALAIFFIKRLWVDVHISDAGRVTTREAFNLWDFFMLFYGAVEGLLKSVGRFFISVGVSTIFLARTDVSIAPGKLWTFDQGYYSFLATVRLSELHNNPVMHVAVRLMLLSRSMAQGGDQLRRRRARFRWALAFTLLNNPALRAQRKAQLERARSGERAARNAGGGSGTDAWKVGGVRELGKPYQRQGHQHAMLKNPLNRVAGPVAEPSGQLQEDVL